MTDKDTGGGAFPIATIDGFTWDGMTLRDWFAGNFAAQMVTTPDWNLNGRDNLADDAYAFADAMLVERSKEEEPPQYTIGDLTLKHVFEESGLTNLSDLQAVLDAVEAALTEKGT